MDLAIVGSRTFSDALQFDRHLRAWQHQHGVPRTIISGGARGVDTLAANYARRHNIPLKVFEADWRKHGRAAGPLRNALIVDACTHVLAFPSRTGRGTQDSMARARAANKPVTVHFVD